MLSTRLSTEEQRRAQLDGEIAELEAQMFGAGQEEQVLDGDNAIAPEGPTETTNESTEGFEVGVIVPEDTRKLNDGETAELRKKLADAEHRFNRYKGSTDRTLHQQRQQIATLSKENASLKQQILDSPSAAPAENELTFSQDVIDILGEETVEAIQRTVNSAKDKADRVEREFKQKEIAADTKVAEDMTEQSKREFMSELQRLVPDVGNMDSDPNFNDWLRQAGLDGVERLERLRGYQGDLDAYGVAQFFIEYKSLQGSKETSQVRDSVSNHIGPAGTQTASSNQMLDKSQEGWVTQSEIDKFNADVSKGVYKYDSVAAAAMEEKIFKAMHEGKINFNA